MPRDIIQIDNMLFVVPTLTKGGVGSGNYGHSGRQGLRGGSGGGTFFHGTTSGALASIRKEGLKAGGTLFMPDGKGGFKRTKAVFMTPNKEIAERYASNDWRKIPKGEYGVVLKLKIPKKYMSQLQDDVAAPSKFFPGDIPPSWIVSAEQVSKADESSDFMYVAIVVLTDGNYVVLRGNE